MEVTVSELAHDDRIDDAIGEVIRLLDDALSTSGWPELERHVHERLIDPGLPPIAMLPLASCASGGGAPEHAARLSAACLLGVTCVRWLDDVADHDREDALCRHIGDARTITLATGALSLAWRTLLAGAPGASLVRRFADATLQTCAGQDLDLRLSAPSVDEAWEIMRGKTGAGFSLLCAGGALIAGTDPAPYEAFGRHVGVMLQLLDDLDSVLVLEGTGDLETGKCCNMVVVHGMHGPHRQDVRELWAKSDAPALRAALVAFGSTRAVLAAAVQERDLALGSLAAAEEIGTPTARLGRALLENFACGAFADLPDWPA